MRTPLVTQARIEGLFPDRRRFAAASAALRVLAIVAALVASPAGAQTKPEDLPPPPGMLLEHGPVLPPDLVAAPDNSKLLSQPIEIPFTAEGGHILIEASMDGGPAKPFYFDTGARNTITPEVARPSAAVMKTARVGGIGPKISQVDIIKVERITIGAATLEQTSVFSTCETSLSTADQSRGWPA